MGTMDGLVTVVTGASTGIGRAITEAFAAEGAAVAVIARTAADVEQAAREVASASGARTIAIAADVSSEAEVESAMAQVEREFGPIDVLVNNAGVPGPRAFMQQHTLAEFEEVLRVNVLGTFLCAKAVAPGMVERGRGRILNMSGGGGGAGAAVRGAVAYATSKGAIEAFTRTAGLELSGRGVLCVAIQPGRVETRGFPFHEKTPARERDHAVSAEYGARLAVWLATEAPLDVAGQTISAVEWARERDERA
jgi:NAD(P)-dependent dehydrogenase (short-subunit alcohol dehydrogenase family)